ncbi:MAG: hypothetical protein KatS3mg031_2627 [Chitinophagales bacterium]|nr:MAG: hypothetical protein KatS3mg031_2627 [Chitinophagales bacterium]
MLALSDSESALSGLRVFRIGFYLDGVEPVQLRNDLIQHRADWCKLRAEASREDLWHQLNTTGFPWYVHSVVYRCQHDLHNVTPLRLAAGMIVEPYRPALLPELEPLLEAIHRQSSGTYYSNETEKFFFNEHVREHIRKAYIRSFYHPPDVHGRSIWMLRVDGQPAGYFAAEVKGSTFEGALFGVHPDFRRQGLARVIYQAALHTGLQLGMKSFETAIHIQHQRSLLPALREGLQLRKPYFYISLYPLLSYSRTHKAAEMVAENNSLYETIIGRASAAVRTFSMHRFADDLQGNKVIISRPIGCATKAQVVIVENADGQLTGHGLITLAGPHSL